MHTKERPPTHATASLKNGSGQLLQMSAGSDTLSFAYDTAGAPYSVKYNGTTYYYITDLQGDVTAIVNGSGVSVAEYTYNAWGKLLTATGTMSATLGALNPLRYRGYVYDAETGFYYLQSRYYDPGICRFSNADAYASTGQGFVGCNMFAYCNNNSVNYSDDYGTYRLIEGWDPSGNSQQAEQIESSQARTGVNGIGISGIAAWGLAVEGAVYFIQDTHGNSAIAITAGIGGGLGASVKPPSISPANGYGTINYPNIDYVWEIEGPGVNIGSTVLIAGYERSQGSTAAEYGNSFGISPKIGLEFHATITYTWVIVLGGRKYD